jgi:hypothetical protein
MNLSLRFKSKTKLALTALIVMTFVTVAGHTQVCRNLFRKFAVEKLDSEYFQLSTTSETAHKAQVFRLLNRAFFPMALKLDDSTKHLTVKTIQKWLKPLSSDKVIRESHYLKNSAVVTEKLEVPDLYQPSFLVPHAAAQAKRTYDVDSRPEIGSAERLFYAVPNAKRIKSFGRGQSVLGLSVAPVGFYGDAFSKRLVKTTQVLMAIAAENLLVESAETFNANQNLLKAEARRVRELRELVTENTPPENAPLGVMLEGISSFHQFLTVVTKDKIPGAEAGTEALRDIVLNAESPHGLTSDFTARLPMGLLGPMNLSGRYFKNAIDRNSAGKLVLADSTKNALARFVEIFTSRRKRSVCPMVGVFMGKRSAEPAVAADERMPGLQHIAESYWRIYQLVEKAEHKEN